MPVPRTTHTIDNATAAAILRRWQTEPQLYVVHNVTAKGPRYWLVGPKAGRAQIKGTGTKKPLPPHLMHVYDMRAVQRRAADGRFVRVPTVEQSNGWRTLNLATVTALRRGREVYVVAPDAA